VKLLLFFQKRPTPNSDKLPDPFPQATGPV